MVKKKVSAKRRAPAFWLVWREQGYNSTPHYKHDTLKSARAEAERLARENPGHRFFVLPALDFAEAIVNAPTWQTAESPLQKFTRTIEEIPF